MSASNSAPASNIRHDLDPFLVMDQIDREISRNRERLMQCKAENEQFRAQYELAIANGTTPPASKPPVDSSYYDQIFESRNQKEREFYSRVRVIEMPVKGKRFTLVYGGTDDASVTVKNAAHRFATFQNAADYFFKGRR